MLNDIYKLFFSIKLIRIYTELNRTFSFIFTFSDLKQVYTLSYIWL